MCAVLKQLPAPKSEWSPVGSAWHEDWGSCRRHAGCPRTARIPRRPNRANTAARATTSALRPRRGP